MNTKFEEYVAANNEINNFLTVNPTLAHQRRALGTNGRLAAPEQVTEFVGGTLHNAGMGFLEEIHNEIDAARPQAEKDVLEAQLEREREELAEAEAEAAREAAMATEPELVTA